MPTLIERLERVMTEKGWEHADVVRISGQSSSVVSQWLGKGSKEIKTIGKLEAAEAIAREAGYNALWIAKGLGPEKPTADVDGGIRFSLADDDDMPLLSRGVAHDLSLALNTESLPRIRWEDLMTADLSRPFELEVIDDALAPEIFKGCVALLDPDRPPEPAWPVLVRDRDGNHYLRDYEAGPGDRWSAVARARGFAPMDSESSGLTIIAAMDGYKRPRPATR